MVVTASDYFGSKPVEKALKMAKKRKEVPVFQRFYRTVVGFE